VNILILIEALERPARKKGVDIRASIPVGHISIRRGKAQGVATPVSFGPAQFVVSNNVDYATLERVWPRNPALQVCTRPRRNPGGLVVNTGVERIFHPGDLAESGGRFHVRSTIGRMSRSDGLNPAFFRPSIADRRIKGLYETDGNTHPGGGTQAATPSGMPAAEAGSRSYPFR